MITVDQQISKKPLFHLQTEHSSYIVWVHECGQLVNLYYGKRLNHSNHLRELYQNYSTQVGSSTLYREGSNLTLDTLQLEYPGYGKGDYRQPAFMFEYEDGTTTSDFTFYDYILHNDKLSPEGMPHVRNDHINDTPLGTLEIVLKERTRNIYIHLFYTPVETTDAMIRFSRVTNLEKTGLKIKNAMSFNMDFPDAAFDMLTLDGMWIRERQVNRTGLRPGILSIDSKKGVSGANHNPFIALLAKETTETHGKAYGFSLLYSGNYTGKVEKSPYDMTRVQMGITDFDFEWHLSSESTFDTPESVLVYSDAGLGGMSHCFHKLVNEYIVNRNFRYKERPVLINNWEATYFDFDEKKLLKLAKEAHKLGIELFVLDDGWFKGRNDDRTSLGDWTHDPYKLPNGLEGLSDKIKKMGMTFGLWVEPEMVSIDSDLYRAHPDWAVKIPGREPSLGRNQLILDLSNPEVIDYLYDSLYDVFLRSNVTYVKWDMNRNFSDVFSNYLDKTEQREFSHRYILGLYKLLTRLCDALPNVLFESCSSGGNRYDLGMLYYMPQTWTSDNTDAVERVEIQYGTSILYPLSTMGAHVSGRPSHQVLRSTPIETRFNVAAFGLLGYELDLTKLSVFDKKVIEKQIIFYKQNRRTLQFGDFYRHNSPFEDNASAWSVVGKDGFILGNYQKLQRPCPALESIKLLGLDPDRLYEVVSRTQYQNISAFGELINPYIPIKIKDGGILQGIVNNRYLYEVTRESWLQPGDVLMYGGLRLHAQFSGTGIDDKTRNVGDFGSRMYIGIGL